MSIQIPSAMRIEKITDPLVPQFIFEWHPLTQKVYVVEISGRHEGGQFVPAPACGSIRGMTVAEHCETHAQFYGFAQTFLRGYKKALCDYPGLSESAAIGMVDRWKSNLFKGQTDG